MRPDETLYDTVEKKEKECFLSVLKSNLKLAKRQLTLKGKLTVQSKQVKDSRWHVILPHQDGEVDDCIAFV